MRKAKLSILLFALMSLSSPPFGFTAEITPGEPAKIAGEGTPIRKLQRGFLNVALSPIDLSAEFQKEQNRETFPPSWFLAIGRGSCYMVGRALTGVYEMVTFLVPYPADYAPVLYPEFTWEKLGRGQSHPKDPSLLQ
jgi:putative exosortase-associated protein (TIGR04073 family)